MINNTDDALIKRIDLFKEGEYSYERAYEFRPNLRTYLHPDDEIRPCVIFAPGGGYAVVCPPEGQLPAMSFYEKGYNCFVLTYTCNYLGDAPLHRRAETDMARAIRFVRKNAAQFHTEPDKIAIGGFSAAGHLCACLVVHPQDIADPDPELNAVSCRPDAAILSYPVITTDPTFCHEGSVENLIGFAPAEDAPEETKEAYRKERDYYSLEKHVTADSTPCFIWHTAPDDLVPVRNSLEFANALMAAGVPVSLHVYPFGPHGTSVTNEAWEKGEIGDMYCYEQAVAIAKRVKSGELVPTIHPEEDFDRMLSTLEDHDRRPDFTGKAYPENSSWPALADDFLRTIFSGR